MLAVFICVLKKGKGEFGLCLALLALVDHPVVACMAHLPMEPGGRTLFDRLSAVAFAPFATHGKFLSTFRTIPC